MHPALCDRVDAMLNATSAKRPRDATTSGGRHGGISSMRIGLYLAVLAVLLAGASTASAHTTIIEPAEAHRPYQRWVDEAFVPTPDITVSVVESPTPCGGEDGRGDIAMACTNNSSMIELVVTLGTRNTFLHELGHIWDATAMQDWQR